MQQKFDRVTAAELVRQFGCWQERAITGPIRITHHGRDRLVMMSARDYEDLVAAQHRAEEPQDADALESVLDHLTHGFIACDMRMVVTLANPAACGHLRTARSSLVGRALTDAVPMFPGSLMHAYLTRAAEAGEATAFDTPSPSVPGRWLAAQTFAFSGGAACLFRDITNQRAAREVADGRAALVAALEAHEGIGTAILSPRGAFLDADATMARLAGYLPEALRHMRMTDVIALDSRVEASRVLETVLTGGGPAAFESALQGGAAARPVRIALTALPGGNAPDGAVMLATETMPVV